MRIYGYTEEDLKQLLAMAGAGLYTWSELLKRAKEMSATVIVDPVEMKPEGSGLLPTGVG